MSSIDINNVIIKVESVHKDLVLLYQLQAIGRHRAATDLALSINDNLLKATVLFASVAKETLSEEIDKQPQLKLV